MKLLTQPILHKLTQNKVLMDNDPDYDPKPVVKLFGGAACTWLFASYDAENRILYGLCDLGMGEAEIGDVSLDELLSIRFKPFNLPVERDRFFEAKHTLTEYAEKARVAGRILA